MAHLYIIRGLPGSGKSTLTNALLWASLNGHLKSTDWYEADMYFDLFHDGKFVGEEIAEAHAWCFGQVTDTLASEIDCIVSNTFTRVKEMQPYIDYCKANGHTYSVIHCQGPWKSVHNVPDRVLENMRNRWENFTE